MGSFGVATGVPKISPISPSRRHPKPQRISNHPQTTHQPRANPPLLRVILSTAITRGKCFTFAPISCKHKYTNPHINTLIQIALNHNSNLLCLHM